MGEKVRRRASGRRWTGDVVAFHLIGYVLLIFFALLCILPFYLIIVSSLTAEETLIREGYSLYIRNFSLESYILCLKSPESVLRAYGMTVSATLIGTLFAVMLASMTGYVLSRSYFKWRNGFSFFFFFTTLFQGGLVPLYIICTRYLGFKNQFYALLLPLMFSVWNMIIAKSFMKGLPEAVIESAKIDGANELTIFFRLILPLSKPLLATLALFSALSYWNDWYHCMLYINDEKMFTLQYYLQRMLNNAEALRRVAERSNGAVAVAAVPLESMKMAMTVIATGPIMLLYPFVQRFFVKGLTIGAVKG